MPLSQSQKATLQTLQKRIAAQKTTIKQKRQDLSRLIKSQKLTAKPVRLATVHVQEQIKNSKRQEIFRLVQALETLQLQYTATRKRFYGKT